ncbi:MAG: rhodanese-related sulfurtransferase [Phycisphaera sp.]|nr:MAG: rhodanese-related sulfurtransferase [Phycisphaera sp.]
MTEQLSKPIEKPGTCEADSETLVAAIYKFADLDGCSVPLDTLRDLLFAELTKHGILGTLILAGEGINGTIAGEPDAMKVFLDFVTDNSAFEGKLANAEIKFSTCDIPPFGRTRVKIKDEIVTMRVPGVSPSKVVGTYVEPEKWNALIDRPDTVVIDTRNDFEVEVGTFQSSDGMGAVNPHTTAFCDFPSFVRENLENLRGKNVAMFCTGGIRCEKATSYLKSLGIDDVFHLKGGILKYLEEVPQEESRWIGECFVFDERVTVNHDLEPGGYSLCWGCRMPLSPDDVHRPEYEKGVSCHRCIDRHDETALKSLRERQRQIELAKARGKRHIGQPRA